MLLERFAVLALIAVVYLLIDAIKDIEEHFEIKVNLENITFHHNHTIEPEKHIYLLHEALNLSGIESVDLSF